MRTIERVASLFSFFNLFFGATGFIGPLVRGNRSRVFNTDPGYQFGIFATNGSHSLMHLILGAIGLIPAVRRNYARQYVAGLGGIYAAMAAMGWRNAGTSQCIHNTMGMAVNYPDNILHTALASLSSLFAIFPDMNTGRIPSREEIGGRMRHIREDVVEKIDEKYPEKMPL